MVEGEKMTNKGKEKVSDKAKALIQNMIYNDMKPGDKLPTETMLSEQFGISRSSIREALQALESARVVEKRNNGTFVTSDMEECFINPLSIMLQLSMIGLPELLELRLLLESEAAGYAACRATEQQIRKLGDLAWMMQKPNITVEEYIDLDTSFHLTMSEAAGNTALDYLIKDVNTVLRRHFPKACTLEFVKSSAIPCLLELADAIKTGNRDKAVQCMTKHLTESASLLRSISDAATD